MPIDRDTEIPIKKLSVPLMVALGVFMGFVSWYVSNYILPLEGRVRAMETSAEVTKSEHVAINSTLSKVQQSLVDSAAALRNESAKIREDSGKDDRGLAERLSRIEAKVESLSEQLGSVRNAQEKHNDHHESSHRQKAP